MGEALEVVVLPLVEAAEVGAGGEEGGEVEVDFVSYPPPSSPPSRRKRPSTQQPQRNRDG